MQQRSAVSRAVEAFDQKDYLTALRMYRALSDSMGERNFRANILICEKRLEGVGRRMCAKLPLREIRVACVADEFTFASYKDTCTLLNLSIDQWAAELETLQPDLLFIESAWRGKGDAWNRKISQASPELLGILDWCKAHNVPTMFWNKEDPVHYGTFLNTAKRFDHVFTTDMDRIGNYKKDLGHERVYLLPFGCNPVEHNPVEQYERKPQACFAGSYYVRYPERARDLDTLLETFLDLTGVEIYDRQFGKDDVNYAFPDKYASLIHGNLKYEDIALAYKGYAYGINLNSVKYSPTMFARRVFELMASNTLVVSNYSKGVRLFFGDLVIASDAGTELAAHVRTVIQDPAHAERLKLAALRKVMTEHTYEQRFSYVAEKVLGRPQRSLLPRIHVLAAPRSQAELDALARTFRAFDYASKTLHVLARARPWKLPAGGAGNEHLVPDAATSAEPLGIRADDFVAFIDADNSYGANYLVDLALATKYTAAKVIAKGDFVSSIAQGDGTRQALGQPYTHGQSHYIDAALLSADHLQELLALAGSDDRRSHIPILKDEGEVFFVDRLSFVPASRGACVTVSDARFDGQRIDAGMAMATIVEGAESIPAAAELELIASTETALYGRRLIDMLETKPAEQNNIFCSVRGHQLVIDAKDGAKYPHYIYTRNPLPIEQLWRDRSGKLFFETTPGLELTIAVIFFDAQGARIGHTIPIANWNQTVKIPPNAASARLGIRVAGGPGESIVKQIIFDHATQGHKLSWVPTSKQLLIAPNYPDYGDYYRYAFVHRRVKSYDQKGMALDVFRFRPRDALKHYEFEGVDVVSGGAEVLNTVLEFSDYSCIAIHSMDLGMWEVVQSQVARKKIVVWLHGAEIQSWSRRAFNYATPVELETARLSGERRDEFWRMIFGLRHPNIHFVFVSRSFHREVVSDLGVEIAPENVHVIHNPIDTDLFAFVRKDPEQRKRILSIRPYASRVYANDISAKAIVALSTRPFFDQLQFLIIGDGVLFDETVAALRGFANVEIRQGFLSQLEIACLHREYGIFLCPSRMDTQGVSRDEAMASGLVPVTNRVGAIPEFVTEGTGFLCDEEDHVQIADAIERLVADPALFTRMSEAAAALVRQDRSAEQICRAEIEVLR